MHVENVCGNEPTNEEKGICPSQRHLPNSELTTERKGSWPSSATPSFAAVVVERTVVAVVEKTVVVADKPDLKKTIAVNKLL